MTCKLLPIGVLKSEFEVIKVLLIFSVAILAGGLFSEMIHINILPLFKKNLIKQFNKDEQFDSKVSLKLIFWNNFKLSNEEEA